MREYRLNRSGVNFTPIFPDVLGAVTGGIRTHLEELECAVGVYPQMAYINQPIEIVVVLQNMVNKELQVKTSLRVPTADRDGNVLLIDSPVSQVTKTLKPAEVGVLRIPIMAHPPTGAVKNLPVRVAIRHKVGSHKVLRPPGGGTPPSVLSVSPFKLQVLRDVAFTEQKPGRVTRDNPVMTVYFDLAPKSIPGAPAMPKPRYESLWTLTELEQELELAKSQYDVAIEIAKPGLLGTLYGAFLEEVEERFAQRNLPLHPGEAMAIAKMMTYTVEDAPRREPGIVLENTRWFRSLCQVLAHDSRMQEHERNEILIKHLFEPILYEAIVVAFNIIAPLVDEELGNRDERTDYANRVIRWINGIGEPDLTYVYLPLVLGGVAIGRLVEPPLNESPWEFADQLEEAYDGRNRLASGEEIVIMEMLFKLIERYKGKLRSQRIRRPDE